MNKELESGKSLEINFFRDLGDRDLKFSLGQLPVSSKEIQLWQMPFEAGQPSARGERADWIASAT